MYISLECSPAQNRSIPPLKYDVVYDLVAQQYTRKPRFTINGEVNSLQDIDDHLEHGVDAVMIGRLFMNDPYQLCNLDAQLRLPFF